MTIPSQVHFCWIGTRLPWAYVFAVLSAAERSELTDIILHHTDVLDDGPELRSLSTSPRVRLCRIDANARLGEAGAALGVGDGLAALYQRLESRVMRTDVLRAAILFLQGGIYLDLDTITVASLLPLLQAAQFVGCEFIVWPHAVRASRSPAVWARPLCLDLLRKLLRRMPGGWMAFRRVQRFYFRGINNAVMGAEPRSRLFSDYLRAMLALPAERQAQRYALGPDLLQDIVERRRPRDRIVRPGQLFYPLPPEISEHWFRMNNKDRLEGVLSQETRVVHWYASVRTRQRIAEISPDYVRKHQHHQLYSKLVCSCIRDLPHAA